MENTRTSTPDARTQNWSRKFDNRGITWFRRTTIRQPSLPQQNQTNDIAVSCSSHSLGVPNSTKGHCRNPANMIFYLRSEAENRENTNRRARRSFHHLPIAIIAGRVRTFLGAPFWRKGRTQSSSGAPDAAFLFPHSSAHSCTVRRRGAAGASRRTREDEGAAEGRPRTRVRRRMGTKRRGSVPPGESAAAGFEGGGDLGG